MNHNRNHKNSNNNQIRYFNADGRVRVGMGLSRVTNMDKKQYEQKLLESVINKYREMQLEMVRLTKKLYWSNHIISLKGMTSEPLYLPFQEYSSDFRVRDYFYHKKQYDDMR